MKKDHRGISLGTYVMLGVTGAVLLGCFLILPGLLGQARGTVDVRQVLSIFQTDGMPSLTLRYSHYPRRFHWQSARAGTHATAR